jgi:4-hydroxy-3-methylbut-2-enyl diphosphate reductase
MLVEIDKKSGFCFGVQNAVETAEKALMHGEQVFSLGPIVHNDKEMERLSSLGLVTISHEQFMQLQNCNVLVRAHGEPPETYSVARKNNITIIEATCPIVKTLQSKINRNWLDLKKDNGQVAIFGKPGHAEVIGLMGHTGNEGILITSPADIDKIDVSRPVALFSQTTMETKEYNLIKELIYKKMKELGVLDPDISFKIHNTVCGQVSNRETNLRTFAANHDIVIFVSGRESSNGKVLYTACKSVNPESYFVSSPEEIRKSWFAGKKSAGICGATSTPKWLIEQIKNLILTF